MPKTIKELNNDFDQICDKYNKILFGNGKAGIVTKVSVLQWQVGAVIGLQIFVIGLLIKLIFFK